MTNIRYDRQVIGGFYYKACKIKKSRANYWEPCNVIIMAHGRMKLIHGRYLYAIAVKTLIVLMSQSWESLSWPRLALST